MQEIRFDIVQTITIAAIVNGLIFSVLLLQKQENREANRFLSLLLFSMCFSLAAQLGIDLGVYNYYPWLHWLPAKLTFWIGPAFYLYVNGQEVGYSEGSMTPAEFDISKYLKEGKILLFQKY